MDIHLQATQLELFHAIFDKSCDAIVIVDAQHRIRYWSQSAGLLFGYDSATVIGTDVNQWVTPKRFRKLVDRQWQDYQQTGCSPVLGKVLEALAATASRGEIWVEFSLTEIHVENERWILAIVRDVKSRKRRESELEKAAKTDSLSGLANRSEFQIQLEANPSDRLAVAILDVDLFKQINDLHGHPIGDEAIQHVAAVLKDVFSDAICLARLGGDEFGILVSNQESRELNSRFEELLSRISGSAYSQRNLSLTISIGVCRGVSGSKPRTLLTAADKAMYASKNAGRNRVTIVDDHP
jgi:diguanylate cyclase (GGDEF)-like protein/PAS domain S-box-containing protein